MPAGEELEQENDSPTAQEPAAQQYEPGELAPAIVTSSRVWKPDELQKANMLGCITDMTRNVSEADMAYRRFHVLETWELALFDRGRQHNEGARNGGWTIGVGGIGGTDKNGIADMDEAGIFATNIFSAQGDIATGALLRGKIKVNFTPKRSKNPRDVAAASAANDYKWVWEKFNANLQPSAAQLGWTDSRVLVWTRSVADRRFGEDEDGNPVQTEISTAHGILESRLPMMADGLASCGYAQIFEEQDYAAARAAYPWMGKKIKPSWGSFSENEFERLARVSVRMGMLGRLIGTNDMRDVTMGYSWFRPGMYFGDNVTDVQKDFLLANFPKGLFVVFAGDELCCCWEESVDEHVSDGMFCRGRGQNRRALGSSDLPIQKRVNKWADLWDAFVRTAIPITVLDSQVFNPEAVSELEATPRRFLSATPNEGQSLADAVGQTPAPQPIQGMAEMFQWYVGPLIQSIDGATPALFGGGEGEDNTVGATQIRLNQSLERFGTPWQMLNSVIARAAWQAAKCCGRNRKTAIEESVEGHGDVNVDPTALAGGEFGCEAETAGMIPESGAQREAKVLGILEMAQQNPQVASIIGTPSNAREIVRGLRLDDVITVDEANWEDGALEDIDILLSSEPLINPEFQQLTEQIAQLTQAHEQSKAGAAQEIAQGALPAPEAIEAGQQVEQQLNQLNQQLQQTPQYLPSVPVAQDDSQDHTTIAATVFSWMGEPDGREIRRKSQKEQPGSMEQSPHWCKWTNIYLYWQGHKELAAKFAAMNQQPAAPRVSINIDPSKLQGATQVEALQKAGIQATVDNGPHEIEQEQRVYSPAGETVIKAKRRL